MEQEHHRAAKGQMVALMQAGQAFQEAATIAGVQISRDSTRIRTKMCHLLATFLPSTVRVSFPTSHGLHNERAASGWCRARRIHTHSSWD